MKLLLILFPAFLFADSIVENKFVIGTAGADPSVQVSCSIDNSQRPSITVTCKANNVTQIFSGVPPQGDTNGVTGSTSFSGNTVNWIIKYMADGTMTYQMAAGTANKSGSL